jgi:hypothetical protein
MRRLAYWVIGIVAVVGAGLLWLTAPYIEVDRVRIDEQPVEITAMFSNQTQDPLCTKLYALVDGHLSNEPILSTVAADVPDPNDDVSLKDGDQLALRGYRYEWRKRNRITGHQVTGRDGRMDVVGWRGPSATQHVSKLDPTLPGTFRTVNYVGCR